MTTQEKNVEWIKTKLIPSLVVEGRLKFSPNSKSTVLRSVNATRLSMDDSFMLTTCYRISVELAESNGPDADISLVKLVVKVEVLIKSIFFALLKTVF